MAHVCPWWLAYTFDNFLRRVFHNPEKILGPYVNDGATVADIGCGMGFFAIGMAAMVGNEGRVMAVDIQPEMLHKVQQRAREAGVASRIRTHRCSPENIGIQAKVDFALAFWMLHEVPDTLAFLKQMTTILKPGRKLLIAEPKGHVFRSRFEEMVSLAEKTALRLQVHPKIRFSHAAVFQMLDHDGAGLDRITG